MIPSQFIPLLQQWNHRIRQAVNLGHVWAALHLFRQLKRCQPPDTCNPNNFTFLFLAKACANLSDLQLSQMIHANILKTPYTSDMYVQTALIDMYVKCSDVGCAYVMFDGMSDRDVASWNTILLGFSQLGIIDHVSWLFNRMRGDGIMPDAVTIMGLTKLLSGLNNGRLLRSVHCMDMKCGIGGDVSVANTWISGYAKCGDLSSAEMVFSNISKDALSVVSWNAMIAGCACFEKSVKAIGIYHRMISGGYRPDLVTFLNLLSAFAQPKYLSHGMLVHSLAVKMGCDVNVALLNTLIHMYSKCGDINSARSIFNRMSERSCCTWTVMIGSYSERGDLDEALSLFHKMEAADKKPDMVTVIHLIAACGKVGALDVGKWIENYSLSKGLQNNVTVCNALLDMYMKCGSIGDAQKLFHTMNAKNLISWTTLIAGFALNGKFQEALDHFNLMLRLGLKPNHVTFLAVLQACTHAGSLQKGCEIFDMMTKTYSINPGLDHYACMTDLLGRKGKLKEALKFIQEMPISPDAGIWGTLLGACKIYRNKEIGEQAALQLFQLEPQAAAPYVEMAKIYASKKDWDGVTAMRLKMKNNQVMKAPGQSVVRVNGECSSFTVEVRFHSKCFRVFETLDSLVLQLRNEIDLLEIEEPL